MSDPSVLDVLKNRVSCGKLTEPGPSPDQLKALKQVAVRAADHRLLRPWRFLVMAGEARERFGDLLVKAREAAGETLDDKQLEKLRAKPLRAPTLIVAIASCVDDPKVPEVEQMLSAGAAVQNMLNAAFAMGLGAMWRTGAPAYDSHVKAGLGLGPAEQIVGFLYLGTPSVAQKPPPDIDPDDYFAPWPGD